ncbi:hypothetical protein [Fretibacter rubidus]|uniref:hypothetical protein n=1 Tax=Fretibacter rubidus TaxID=570162 RepID=UPI00352B43E4
MENETAYGQSTDGHDDPSSNDTEKDILPPSAKISGTMLLGWIGLMAITAIIAVAIMRFGSFNDATKITVLDKDGEVIEQPAHNLKDNRAQIPRHFIHVKASSFI